MATFVLTRGQVRVLQVLGCEYDIPSVEYDVNEDMRKKFQS